MTGNSWNSKGSHERNYSEEWIWSHLWIVEGFVFFFLVLFWLHTQTLTEIIPVCIFMLSLWIFDSGNLFHQLESLVSRNSKHLYFHYQVCHSHVRTIHWIWEQKCNSNLCRCLRITFLMLWIQTGGYFSKIFSKVFQQNPWFGDLSFSYIIWESLLDICIIVKHERNSLLFSAPNLLFWSFHCLVSTSSPVFLWLLVLVEHLYSHLIKWQKTPIWEQKTEKARKQTKNWSGLNCSWEPCTYFVSMFRDLKQWHVWYWLLNADHNMPPLASSALSTGWWRSMSNIHQQTGTSLTRHAQD